MTQNKWKHMCPQKHLYRKVHNNSDVESQKVEIIQMPINWWVGKNKTCSICTVYIIHHQEEWTILYMLQSWMDFRNIMLSENSQVKKDHIFYDSIYIIYPQKVKLWIWEVAWCCARGLRDYENGHKGAFGGIMEIF